MEVRPWCTMNLGEMWCLVQEMSVWWVIVINGISTMQIRTGRKEFSLMFKTLSSVTVKSWRMTWFTRLTGWRNGDVHDLSGWEHSCHSMSNIWLNLFQIVRFILLTTLLLTICMEISTEVSLECWVFVLTSSLMIFGVMSYWARSTRVERFLNISLIYAENHSYTGTL